MLSCNDLNFTWSDDLKPEHYFVKWIDMEDYSKQFAGVVDKHINIYAPILSMALLHSDGTFLAEQVITTF
jgi:hypothetical protein